MGHFLTGSLGRTADRRFLVFLAAVVTTVFWIGIAGSSVANAADGTIVVTKGGERSASSSVSGATTYANPVEGATFEYTQGNPTLPATAWTAFPSATGLNGQASVAVPPGTYFVREKSGGSGTTDFGPVQSLNWGTSSNPPAHPYVAKVVVLSGQSTYAYPHSNTNPDPAAWTPVNTGSGTNNGSPFLNVYDNQGTSAGCGKNLLLVLDRSGSISNFASEYSEAAKQFVDRLDGTPTQIGIISFNDVVNSYEPATGSAGLYRAPLSLSVSGNAALLKATINNIYSGTEGSTNWDGALNAASAAKSFTPNGGTGQTANPDEVIFITDGNPTVNDTASGGVGSSVGLFDLTAGMASANKVKTQTARQSTKLRLLAIGVGSGVTVANLRVVSGPNEGINEDYANPTVSELAAALDEYAASQCGGRVYIRKQLKTDSSNQAGWKYSATDPRPGFAATFLDGNPATHSTGLPPVIQTAAFFQKLPPAPTKVTVAEQAAGQPLANFSLSEISCRDTGFDSGVVVPGNRSGLAYELELSEGEDVYCTFVNEALTSLSLTKTPDNQTINAGEDAVFTLAVSNTGSSAASNVTLSDTLPAPGVGGWTIVSQPAGDPCGIVGNQLSCAFGELAPAASRSVVIKTGTSFAACAVYDNPTATADADNAQSVSDSGKITCQKPNLSVEKTGNGTINAGENAVFSVKVSNDGPGTAKAVTVSDTLPTGTAGAWTIDPANPDCQIAAGVLSCAYGDLASGATKTVTVKAPTSFQECATYKNIATTGATNHPSATDDDTVTCQKPGLAVLKVAANASISAGDTAEFSVTVSNEGLGTATNVTLSDTLPTGTAGAWTIDPANPDCEITGSFPAEQTLACQFDDLAAGESAQVTVKALTAFEECVLLENLAVAEADNAEPVDDGATIDCQKPNLSVEKTGNGTINAGENAVFSVKVSNDGPGTAKAVTVSDTLPTGTAGAWTIDPANPDCQIAAGVLSCAYGDLASGATKTVTVKAPTSFQECATYKNIATTGATNHPSATDDDTVTCQKPNLSVLKTGNGPVSAGEDIEFTISTSNSGPGKAADVTLTDPLPGGTAGPWVISSQPAGNPSPCQITEGTLSCAFGDLASGASETVKVKAPTSPAECTAYDNTAEATATNALQATEDASVICRKPEVLLRKTVDKQRVFPGEQLRYTVWMRNRIKDTVKRDFKICDRLPGEVTLLDRNGGSFEKGLLCWKIDQLGYTSDWTVRFSYTVTVNRGVQPGTRIRNLVFLEKDPAAATVIVKRPQRVGARRGGRTPVTG